MLNRRLGNRAMLPRNQLLSYLTRLGKEFQKRQMMEHVGKLRLYYLAVKNGLTSGGNRQVDLHWTQDFTLSWMRTLQVPPFEHDYPVRPRGSHCRRCGDGHGSRTVFVDAVFPGGSRMKCQRCEDSWLEHDDTGDAKKPAWITARQEK
jgi:hypothetical protein